MISLPASKATISTGLSVGRGPSVAVAGAVVAGAATGGGAAAGAAALDGALASVAEASAPAASTPASAYGSNINVMHPSRGTFGSRARGPKTD
jgi:hypothetical protein